ncbi:MAG: HD domain-containing protein [Anaerolineales bacterium]|nr:HD domain-containing protein [Anaerolineales bacterium]
MNKEKAQTNPFLREIKVGDRFIGYYLLRYKQMEQFRDPAKGYFLSLVLADRTGQLSARIWENAENSDQDIQQGDVVKVDGELETYLDKPQIRVNRIRVADKNEYDLRNILPSTTKDIKEMQKQLGEYINSIQDQHLKNLVNSFFRDKDFLGLFSQAPAAKKVHHAYLGGLLEHTLEVLHLSTSLIELYPLIKRDLLVTGILLHDIGKVYEYSWEIDVDYTDEGRLLGHVVIGDEKVSSAIIGIDGFPDSLKTELRHVLLSHHGRYEWGAPRRPKTLEAIALHHLENLDVQVNRFKSLIENRPIGEDWTEYDRMLGRKVYSGNTDDDSLNIEEKGYIQ